MSAPPPGIYRDIPLDEYLAWPYLSKSGLMALDRSPGHYQLEKAQPRKPTDAMVFGSAVDCLWMEGLPLFISKYIAAPEGLRRDRRTKAYREFLDAAAGRTVLTSEQWEWACAIRDHLVAHPILSDLRAEGETQLSLVWDDPEFGVRLKGRPDLVTVRDGRPCVLDLKLTRDPRPDAFRRTMANLRYHWQAYLYLQGITEVEGVDHDEFLFVAVEDHPPFAIWVYQIDDSALLYAREEIFLLVDAYLQCTVRGVWPTQPETITTISLPRWATWKEGDHE
jgi:exodeoxyribonuclease VIII